VDPRLFAAIGGIAIGLVASAIIYLMTMRRVKIDLDRRAVRSWTLAFTLAICTLMGVIPLLDTQYVWVLALPLLGKYLALDTLHRIGSGRAGNVN